MGGLSAEEAHDAAVGRMGYLFASVATTAELIDRIAVGARPVGGGSSSSGSSSAAWTAQSGGRRTQARPPSPAS